VVARTDKMMASLEEVEARLADPESSASQQPPYCENRFRARSERAQIFVFIPICTHLGCVPSYRPEVAPPDLDPDWLGGYFCPCHGSRYDLAARVYRRQPAPKNMAVPPYAYLDDHRLVIGEDTAPA
jgi:ubiquinol-cytochrome c reductase iron-sulfur subunit